MTSSGPPKGETSAGIPPANLIRSVGWRERLLWLTGRRLRFRVSGCSMQPLLNPDDEVLVRSQLSYNIGDIVLAQHPFRSDVRVIKQVSSFDAAGHAFLEGTNPGESTDSRTLGHFAPNLLIGRVTSRF